MTMFEKLVQQGSGRIRLSCLLLLSFLTVTVAYPWGATGHRIINLKAPMHLPDSLSALKADSSFYGAHASDPDNRKNSKDTSMYAEANRHYIDLDWYPNYMSLPHDFDSVVSMYGWANVKEQGINPWATVRVFDSLVAQFRRGDYVKAESTMSDLGHYVGDSHQPLHCTENYDGDLTGNSGIHSRYETYMINTYQSSIVIVPASIYYVSSPIDFIFDYTHLSLDYVDSIMLADTYAKGISGWSGSGSVPASYYAALWLKVGGFTRSLIQQATVDLASLWYTAWVNAQSSSSPVLFTLTVGAANGTLTLNPSQTQYDSGAAVQLTATPNPGYYFTGWSGDLTGTLNPTSVVMNGNWNITANFAIVQVHSTVQTNLSGRSFSVDGVTYSATQVLTWNYGSSHTIAATSPQSGSTGTQYVWNNWSDGGTISHVVSSVRDTSFTANFLAQYALTLVAAVGGTVGADPPSAQWYNSEAAVQITATSSAGYSFTSWRGSGSGSCSGTNNPASITMNGPVFDTAFFSINTYTITVLQSSHGMISPGTAVVNYGDSLTFSAVSDSGYVLDSLIVDGANVDSTSTFTFSNVTSSHTIRPVFGLPTYRLVFNVRWNMVSLPYDVTNPRKDIIFPHAVSEAFAYAGRYVSADTIRCGVGYWLKFASRETVAIVGGRLVADTILVHPGWNMIGSIGVPIAATSILSDPPGIVTTQFFGYDNKYVPSDTIYSANGYWVKVNQEGSLILAPNSPLRSLAKRIMIIHSTELPPPSPDGKQDAQPAAPVQYAFDHAYPNPFNPSATIRYQLPVDSRVKLTVINTLGQIVATLVDEVQQAGYKQLEWNASTASSGVYFCRIEAISLNDHSNVFTGLNKLLLLK